jgi:hypothetical protein
MFPRIKMSPGGEMYGVVSLQVRSTFSVNQTLHHRRVAGRITTLCAAARPGAAKAAACGAAKVSNGMSLPARRWLETDYTT